MASKQQEPEDPAFLSAASNFSSFLDTIAEDSNTSVSRIENIDQFNGLDLEYLNTLSKLINKDATSVFAQPKELGGGTAYMCTKDNDGNAVSLIQSNFHGIGSTIGVDNFGFFLHNRGAGFNLIQNHPNSLKQGRKPLHTLSPTMWSVDGNLDMVIGTRGGRYQPQLLSHFILKILKNENKIALVVIISRSVSPGLFLITYRQKLTDIKNCNVNIQ